MACVILRWNITLPPPPPPNNIQNRYDNDYDDDDFVGDSNMLLNLRCAVTVYIVYNASLWRSSFEFDC